MFFNPTLGLIETLPNIVKSICHSKYSYELLQSRERKIFHINLTKFYCVFSDYLAVTFDKIIIGQTAFHDILDQFIFSVVYNFYGITKKKFGVINHQTSKKAFYSKGLQNFGHYYMMYFNLWVRIS